MENTFGCWSGNMRHVYSTAHNSYMIAMYSYSDGYDSIKIERRRRIRSIWFFTPIQTLNKPEIGASFHCSEVLFCFSWLLCWCHGPAWPSLLAMTQGWIGVFWLTLGYPLPCPCSYSIVVTVSWPDAQSVWETKHEVSERKGRADKEQRQEMEERKQRVLAQLPGNWKTLVKKFTIKTTDGGNSLANNFLQE